MVRDTIQLETAVSTISQEYLLEFTSDYDITEDLHPELPGPGDKIVDFPEGKVGVYTKFFVFANFRIPISQFIFDILGHYQIHLSQMSVISAAKRTPIQKQPEPLLCLVGLSQRYFLRDDVYPTFLNDDDRDIDLFNLIRAPNPTKVKIGTRPRAAHEVPLLTVTTSRVIVMEEPAAATESSGTPSTIERECDDDGGRSETDLGEEVAAMGPRSTARGKSLASVGLETGSTFPVPAPQETPTDASDPDPLSYANPQSISERDVAQSSKGATIVGDPESENTSFTSMAESPGNIYQPGWGMTNGCRLDTPEACQNLVDHLAQPGFEHEAKLLKKSVAHVARRDQRIQARENEIKNLEALLEAEADMKKAAEAKNAKLAQVTREEKFKVVFEEFKKYEDDRVEQRCAEMDARLDALIIDFDEELYPHMLTATASRRWVIGHGLRLAVMKCVESTELRKAFTDVVSARIAKGMSEGLKHGVEHGKASLDLEAIKAYDPEADTKFFAALHALRDLKYLMVDQLESLKDAPIDVIMASLHLESNSGSDGVPVSVPTVAPQGLVILLADAATQTETFEDEASPRLVKPGEMQVVPPPMTGNYLPSRPDIEIDDSQ
ncbi:hypothetical protein Tco_0969341 [Tanacetum coccineum]